MSRYSFTQLETFSRCAKQYQFKHILKVTVPERTSARIYLGSVVHRILEELHKAANFERLPSRESLLADYDSEWETEGARSVVVDAEHQTVEDFRRMGRSAVERYYDEFAKQPFGKSLIVEENTSFALPQMGSQSPIQFSAKIDRLWRRADGVVEIADFKTGTSLAPSDSSRFRRQMGIYQLAVLSKWPDLAPIQVVQHFLTLGERVTYTFEPEQLDVLAEEIREEVRKIRLAVREENFPEKEGGHCRWCSYESFCPVKKYRQVIAGEAGDATHAEISSAEGLQKLALELFELHEQKTTATFHYEAVRSSLERMAKELGQSSVPTPIGRIGISRKTEVSIVSKSRDEEASAQAQALIRSWGYDDYLIVDLKAFVSDMVVRGRISREQYDALLPFLINEERVTVRTTRNKRKGEVATDQDGE